MSIISEAQQQVKTRRVWLRQANKALAIIKTLPKEIQQLEGSGDYSGNYQLALTVYGGSNAQLSFECYDGIFGKPELIPTTGKFRVIGKLNDIDVTIYDIEKPPNCVVYAEKYEATRYRSSCDDKKEEEGGVNHAL